MNVSAAIAMAALGLSGCMAGMGGMKHDGAGHESPATTDGKSAPPAAPAAAPASAPKAEIWKCPMGHFEGTAPGKCPTCGMDLVKSDAK